MSRQHPTDPAERNALREQVRRRRVEQAEADAYRSVRTIVCGEYGRHEPNTTCSGALNCLCDCHDRAGT